MVLGGVFWSLTYVLIIKRGFNDKTFGMPFIALSANISWETIFSFVHPHLPPQLYINYAWFSLDLVIVVQFLRYGASEFQKFSPRKICSLFMTAVAISSLAIYLICYQLDDWQGAYAAFGQNLVMSVFFIMMLRSRNHPRGQSIYIGLFKMAGTAVSSIAFYLYQPISHQSLVLPAFYVLIFVCDVIYIVLLYQKCARLNIPVWKRI